MKTSKKTQKIPAKKMEKKTENKTAKKIEKNMEQNIAAKPVVNVMQKEMPKEAPVAVVPGRPNFKIQPLADRVLIKEDIESKEEKTASGIIIPISAQEEKNGKRGKVVAIGDGRIEDGKFIPISVNVGDAVLFQWGDKIKVDNEEYYLVKESEIMAIINK